MHSLYWEKLHITDCVARQPEVVAHRFLSVHLGLLGSTAKVLSKPNLGWSAGTANILGATQLNTLTRLFGTGHTVHNTRGVTADVTTDGVALPGVVAGVCGGVI